MYFELLNILETAGKQYDSMDHYALYEGSFRNMANFIDKVMDEMGYRLVKSSLTEDTQYLDEETKEYI